MSSEVTTAGPTSAPSVTLVSAARLEQDRAMVGQARRRASSREAMAITLTVMERSLVWNQSVLCIITPGNWVKASQLTVPLVWVGAPLGVQAEPPVTGQYYDTRTADLQTEQICLGLAWRSETTNHTGSAINYWAEHGQLQLGLQLAGETGQLSCRVVIHRVLIKTEWSGQKAQDNYYFFV